MFDDESTISDSPDPDNTTTPQDHSSTRAKFDRTRAWEVLGFGGVTKVTSSERHTSSPPIDKKKSPNLDRSSSTIRMHHRGDREVPRAGSWSSSLSSTISFKKTHEKYLSCRWRVWGCGCQLVADLERRSHKRPSRERFRKEIGD